LAPAHDRAGSTLVVDFEMAVCGPDPGVALDSLEQALANGGAVIIAESNPLSCLTSEAGHLLVGATERDRWNAAIARGVFGTDVTDVGGAGSDAARQAYFRTLWHQCERSEQLTLIQMSEEGFTNPHSAASVERLLAKGLVVTGPLRPMSLGFRHFVRSQAAHLPEVKKWEYPEGAFGWHQARWVLLLLLVAGVALAWATGENWIKGATAFLTMLAGGFEAFQKAVAATERLRPTK
jgi:hypothetical protein